MSIRSHPQLTLPILNAGARTGLSAFLALQTESVCQHVCRRCGCVTSDGVRMRKWLGLFLFDDSTPRDFGSKEQKQGAQQNNCRAEKPQSKVADARFASLQFTLAPLTKSMAYRNVFPLGPDCLPIGEIEGNSKGVPPVC